MKCRSALAVIITVLTMSLKPALAAGVAGHETESGMQFALDDGMLDVQWWSDGIVRITYFPGKQIPEIKSLAVVASPTISRRSHSENEQVYTLAGQGNVVSQAFDLAPDEGIYGLADGRTDVSSALQNVASPPCNTKSSRVKKPITPSIAPNGRPTANIDFNHRCIRTFLCSFDAFISGSGGLVADRTCQNCFFRPGFSRANF